MKKILFCLFTLSLIGCSDVTKNYMIQEDDVHLKEVYMEVKGQNLPDIIYSKTLYNEYGDVVYYETKNKEKNTSSTSYEYKYNKNGNKIYKKNLDSGVEQYFDNNGTLVKEVISSYTYNYTYQYDQYGNIKEIFINGTIYASYINSYNDKGQLIKATRGTRETEYRYDSEGYLLKEINKDYNYTYDKNGTIIVKEKKDSGKIIETSYYDSYGNVYCITNEIKGSSEYFVNTYDEKGNLITVESSWGYYIFYRNYYY